MKKYFIMVAGMTAYYTGERYAESENDAIEKVREEYRKNKDSRAGWRITATEMKEGEE